MKAGSGEGSGNLSADPRGAAGHNRHTGRASGLFRQPRLGSSLPSTGSGTV